MEKIEHRAVIKFLTREGVHFTEITKRMKAVYKEASPSESTVRRWANEFKRGRESLEDDARSGRPETALNSENVAKVEKLVLEDRRITVKTLASAVKIDEKSVRSILHDRLRMNKVSSRWVPRMLTTLHKQNRVTICSELLARAGADSGNFFDRIVTMDETWVHHYDPETKQASMEWRHSNSPPPRKFRTKPSAGKVMLSVFWDSRGILLIDFLENGHTINGKYYCDLLSKLRDQIKSKRRGLLRKGVLLQHDNASSHKCVAATSKAAELGFEILPHPAYSPDLAPSDFFLFGKLKAHLRGTHFKDDESLKTEVTSWLEDQDADFYKEGIFKLKHRWAKCVDLAGDYIEKS